MATAEKNPISTVVKHEVTLTLSEDEAAALMTVLGCVGGDPSNTGRKHIDGISTSLKAVGFDYISRFRTPDLYPLEERGGIYFAKDTLNIFDRMTKSINTPNRW